MARGSIAKQQVANKLAEVLGNDWMIKNITYGLMMEESEFKSQFL